MKKKKIIIITILLFILFISPVLVYNIKSSKATNIITFGNLKMRLTEYEIKNNKAVQIKNNSTIDVSKNPKIERKFKIENVCRQPMFVRISFNFENNSNVDVIQISKDWIYKDNWYYYKNKLEPSKEATIDVNFVFDVQEIYKLYDKKIDLDIKAQALQSKNNEQYVLDAVGWPAE